MREAEILLKYEYCYLATEYGVSESEQRAVSQARDVFILFWEFDAQERGREKERREQERVKKK